MGDPEENTNGTGTKTVGQDLSRTNTPNRNMGASANNQSNYLFNWGQRVGSTRNKQRQLRRYKHVQKLFKRINQEIWSSDRVEVQEGRPKELF